MGRDIGPKCRKCRREGEKLFLKGERCYTRKCPASGRSSPPGERGRGRRRRPSQYQIHLREKQKARRIYGVREAQFRNYVEHAKGTKGVTGDALLSILEKRLDNVVYRSGLASSRSQARQLVVHGHFELNDRSVNIPSMLIDEGDTIAVKEDRKGKIKQIVEGNEKRSIPSWIEKNAEAMKVQVSASPNVEEVEGKIAANLIVEFYSR